jgi:hypothetical protein
MWTLGSCANEAPLEKFMKEEKELLKLFYFLKCLHHGMPKTEVSDQNFPVPFLILKNIRMLKYPLRLT